MSDTTTADPVTTSLNQLRHLMAADDVNGARRLFYTGDLDWLGERLTPDELRAMRSRVNAGDLQWLRDRFLATDIAWVHDVVARGDLDALRVAARIGGLGWLQSLVPAADYRQLGRRLAAGDLPWLRGRVAQWDLARVLSPEAVALAANGAAPAGTANGEAGAPERGAAGTDGEAGTGGEAGTASAGAAVGNGAGPGVGGAPPPAGLVPPPPVAPPAGPRAGGSVADADAPRRQTVVLAGPGRSDQLPGDAAPAAEGRRTSPSLWRRLVDARRRLAWVGWIAVLVAGLVIWSRLGNHEDRPSLETSSGTVTTPTVPATLGGPAPSTVATTAPAPATTVAAPATTAPPVSQTQPPATTLAPLPENRSVFFAYNSSSVPAEATPIIAAVAADAKARPGVKVQYVGVTDARGNATSNRTLALRRAQAVLDAVKATGYDGPAEVVFGGIDNNPDAAQARRVDIVFVRI